MNSIAPQPPTSTSSPPAAAPPTAPAPVAASAPDATSASSPWWKFWKKGGARKKTRKNPVLATSYFRQMRVVNGKVCSNREYRVIMTNKGQHIVGHNGKRKFNMTRRFKKRKGRKMSRRH